MRNLLLLFIFLPSLAYSFTFPIPNYLSLQTGAYTGFTTIGALYELSSKYELEGQIGYTPAALAGVDITSFDLKLHWNHSRLILDDNVQIIGYSAAAILYSNDRDMFIILPSRYPREYYDPSAIKWLFTFGTVLEYHLQYKVYMEYTYTDVEFIKYYNNFNSLSLQNLGSLGLGIRYRIN